MAFTANIRAGIAAALATGLVFGFAGGADAGPRIAKRAVVVTASDVSPVHYRRHHRAHRHVHVDAPYTTTSRRRVVVDAPYAGVSVRRGRGVYVSAPFVDLRVAR